MMMNTPDHGPVQIFGSDRNCGKKIGIENSVFESKQILNRSKFGFGSGLGSQNREPNRRFTVPTVLGGSVRVDQKKFKFF